MRCEYVISDTGKRGIEFQADGLAEKTVWKKKVTRSNVAAHDKSVAAIISRLKKLTGKKDKEGELIDASYELLLARVDGITNAELDNMDVADVGALNAKINGLYEADFIAKKNV